MVFEVPHFRQVEAVPQELVRCPHSQVRVFVGKTLNVEAELASMVGLSQGQVSRILIRAEDGELR